MKKNSRPPELLIRETRCRKLATTGPDKLAGDCRPIFISKNHDCAKKNSRIHKKNSRYEKKTQSGAATTKILEFLFL